MPHVGADGGAERAVKVEGRAVLRGDVVSRLGQKQHKRLPKPRVHELRPVCVRVHVWGATTEGMDTIAMAGRAGLWAVPSALSE